MNFNGKRQRSWSHQLYLKKHITIKTSKKTVYSQYRDLQKRKTPIHLKLHSSSHKKRLYTDLV